MKSIRELIEKLKGNPTVAGLIEYGSASYEEDEIAGDYDIFAILTERDTDVESIHFYIGEIPVDLNLRTLDDIRRLDRCKGFDIVLLDGRIIHDPSGTVAKETEALRVRHEVSNPSPLPAAEIGGLRHGPRHTLDKLRNGRYANTTLGCYLLHQCVYWALSQYFRVRNLPCRGEKAAFDYLRAQDPGLCSDFERFYASNDFEFQLQTMQAIAEKVLEPIGGLWSESEVLTFGNPEKGEDILHKLIDE